MRQHAHFPITESLRAHFCEGLDELLGSLRIIRPLSPALSGYACCCKPFRSTPRSSASF
jgi:hypothetical protein